MKIAIICPDFQKSNLRKLPWKYIYELTKYLNDNHEVVVITDSDKRDINGICIFSIKKIFKPLKGETKELLNILERENPDKCIMLLGLTSFLRTEFKINNPVIGIFTSPIYPIRELIKNIGLKDSYKYRKYTLIHYLNALIPNFLIRKWQSKFDRIVFMSNDTFKKLVYKGLSPKRGLLIPPGLDEEFLILPEYENVNKIKNIINPEGVPVIMYFTSPLTLRGTDILVKAFAKVRKEINCKLIFLSRIDYFELLKEEKILKEIANKEGVSNSVEIISKYLNPKEIKEYLSASDIICLPFKIVISDIPISLLEAMALGKPVISTNVACIPEILNGNGKIVKANDSDDLADVLISLINHKDLIYKLVNENREYPSWDHNNKQFLEIIERDN